MAQTILPVKVANDEERHRKWSEITQSPQDFLNWLVKLLGVDATQIAELTDVVISPTIPQGNERVWFKTSDPVAVGIPTTNGYRMIYQYPSNTPLLWLLGQENLPNGFIPIPEGSLPDYGLTAPGNESYLWVIFEPGSVVL